MITFDSLRECCTYNQYCHFACSCYNEPTSV